MIFKLINFIIFAVVLTVLLKKPLRSFIKERREYAEKIVGTARITFESAKAAESTLIERIKDLGSERGTILKTADSSAEKESAKIIENAKLYAKNIKEDAETFIKFESRQMSIEIKKETVAQAVEIATEKIKTTLTPSEDKNLSKGFVESLKA